MSSPRLTLKHAHRILAVLLMGIVAVGFATPVAAQSTGSGPRCGDTITADTTLHRDLLSCPGSGLIIGADNVTLDLNGHTLDADTATAGDCQEGSTCTLGVDNTAGYDGVTVKDGRITDFSFGIILEGASDNVLSRLTVTRHRLAGVMLIESTGGRVERSVITRNGLTSDFAGFNVFVSTGVVIERNVIAHNGDIGLFIVEGSSGNTIRRNYLAGNPESGILLDGDDNIVDRNVFVHNGGGIGFGGNGNHVTRNLVLDVGGCGEEGCGPGIGLEAGSDNVISRNVVRNAPTGIAVEAYGPFTTGTVVSRNVVKNSEGDGVAVDVVQPGGVVTDTLVKRNRVTRSSDDGIDVGGRPATLSRNRAFENGDLGIEAVAGVTDGGGNTAARNGNPLQCVNVSCKAPSTH